MPHVIRLREPWDARPQPDGSVRFSRRFHKPTGLEGSKVWLVVEAVDAGAVIELNGCVLGKLPAASREARFDITAALDGVNLVEITLPAAHETPRLGPVRLEIEEDLAQRHGGTEG